MYGSLLDERIAVRLFGRDTVHIFRKHYFELAQNPAFLGRGNVQSVIKKRSISMQKLKEAEAVSRIYRYIPWVLFVGVSGSVSYLNAEQEDDIDLFLVVSRNRLWITRLVEYVMFRALSKRRAYNDTIVRDKFCVNAYLSEQCLDVSEFMKPDICTALELVQIKPIYKKEYYSKIISKNLWIRTYFEYYYRHIFEKRNSFQEKRRLFLISRIVDYLDWGVGKLQLLYMQVMRHHPELSVMSENALLFFPSNQWDKKRKELHKRLKPYKV